MVWALAIGLLLSSCGGSRVDVTADASPRPNYIFATSTTHAGDLGGVAGADAICANDATAAGLDGTFVAWISGGTSMVSRLDGSRGWARTDGVPIADLPSDFLLQRILNPLAVDELGNPIRAGTQHVWTGTRGDGGHADTCMEWTSTATSATYGDLHHGGSRFTAQGSESCDTPNRLLCVEVGRVVPVVVAAGSGPFAFVTSGVWASGAGRASADAACQTDAQQAGLPGSYLAALPTSTETTAARFDLDGAPWTRPDGVALAPTAEQLFTSDYLSSFPNRTADGQPIDVATWAGDPLSLADWCTDWTLTTGNWYGIVGDITSDRRGEVFGLDVRGCHENHHLLCLQH